ncbi:hypothetical protein FACS1894161_5540 [Spirochaetia bacterium]|nr:hypothetical protein FACS1894161_5540 [Spirochaetia bacterium]
MSIKTEPWNIANDLITEDKIRLFVEASIGEARDDTDPHAFATAVEARARFDAKNNVGPVQKAVFVEAPRLSDFNKTARLFGYHITLTPVA